MLLKGFMLGVLMLISALGFSQPIVVELDQSTNSTKSPIPSDRHFILKVKVAGTERIEGAIVRKVNRFKTKDYDDSGIYRNIPANLNLREFKLSRKFSKHTPAPFYKERNLEAFGYVQKFKAYNRELSDIKILATDGSEDEDFKNLISSYLYVLDKRRISYSKDKSGTYALIRVPPLDPNRYYEFIFIENYSREEKLTLYTALNQLADSSENDSTRNKGEINFGKLIDTVPKDKMITRVSINDKIEDRDSRIGIRSNTDKINYINEFLYSELKVKQFGCYKDGESSVTKTGCNIHLIRERVGIDELVSENYRGVTVEDYDIQRQRYFTPEIALFGTRGNSARSLNFATVAGLNINFRPINRGQYIRSIDEKDILHWTSFFIGSTIPGLGNIEKESEIDYLFGRVSPVTGFGFRFSKITRAHVSTIWIHKNDENPIIDKNRVAVLLMIGVSVDLNIGESVTKLFGSL